MLGWRSVSISRVGLVLYGIVVWGCSRPAQGPPAELASRSKLSASIRLLVTGDVAGIIEPCGCVKDQLGGLDRFASAVLNSRHPNSTLLLEAGSLLFPLASDDANERDELLLRAETLAQVMHSLGLLAWSPGKADCALGEPTLRELTKQLGATSMQSCAASGDSTANRDRYLVAEIAGTKVGFFGLPSTWTQPSTSWSSDDAEEWSKDHHSSASPIDLETRLRQAATTLESKGAKLKIAVLNAAPGAVSTVARQMNSFQLLLVGGSSEHSLGADSDGAEPRLVGSTLVVEPPNHLRGLVIVDFVVVDGKFEFQDATGIGRNAERMEVAHRIDELKERIVLWKKQSSDRSLLAAREADLKRLEIRYKELSEPAKPPTTSHFKIQNVPIGNGVSGNPDVKRALEELGTRINRKNQDKFAHRKAAPAAPGQAAFVGVSTCEGCHQKQASFWRTTRHSNAYRTLVDKERQFTLECVGCHVTGYEQPGGSNVTDVAELKDVQCENCHGPGSIHSKTTSSDSIQRIPARQLCASRCHHSPHVAPTWAVEEAWPKIIGEGHGR
jgi:hypothetical protein